MHSVNHEWFKGHHLRVIDIKTNILEGVFL